MRLLYFLIYSSITFLYTAFLGSCQKETSPPLFQLLSPSRTGIDFINEVSDRDSLNIIQYLYFYNGGGVAVGDVNNDELPDIYFSSNLGPNRLYLNRGNNTFEDITTEAGVVGRGNWSTGVTMVDINADGWLDIYLCQVGNYKGFKGKNQLFINQGKTDSGKIQFTENAAEYGLDHAGFSTQAAFFDYDLDGDLDMYLLCHSVHSTESYRDTSVTRRRDELAGDKLFQNNGRFEEVSAKAGIYGGIAGYGLGLAIGDIDKNGCPDIYVGNDFHENDFLYLNNCDGTFSEHSTKALGHFSNFSMGNDLADINNDGWLDILTLDMKPADETVFKSSQGFDSYDIYRFKRSYGYHHQFPRNMLQINRGRSGDGQVRFSEIGQIAGVAATDWSWSALLADFDNDGWKDLYITNGIVRRPNDLDYLKFIANRKIQEEASDLELAAQMPEGKVSNYYFANAGNYQFSEQTRQAGVFRPSLSNGAAYADLDNDGDLDLIVNNINEPAFIYENQSSQRSSHHHLKVKLKGPELNPYGVGTKISLYHDGSRQYQELYPTRGWQSSVDHILHFGLNGHNRIDSLVVDWPDGRHQLLVDLAVNQTQVIKYAESRPPRPPSTAQETSTFFVNASGEFSLDFRHRENLFFDNTRESLIPYLISTQGPRLAVGDANGDELQDFYVGGASGQSGRLFLQKATGRFEASIQQVFLQDSLNEDTGMAFLDADNDGDLDLYLGSGGNQYYHQDPALIDRLLFNDGKGNFSKRTASLPLIYNQTSCVVPGDFDQDGDVDLFVGSRSVPVNYGIAPDSYLLENDGEGNFTDASERIPALKQLGMVTDAAWTDVDGDGDPDLAVVGEWMPLTFFMQEDDRFTKKEIPKTSGWWSTLAIADIDSDGDEDWIAGNFGMNSDLQPSTAQPVRLYIGDFDRNLSRDPILSYYREDKEYPYAGLDELSKQLVFLRKRFPEYGRFSGNTLTGVFSEEELKSSSLLQAQTFYSVLVKNVGEANFQIESLPFAAQIAPVQSILYRDLDGDTNPDILLGGNFYEMQPSIGRMDASYGVLLRGDGKGVFQAVENRDCGLWIEGQVRDMEILPVRGKPVMIVARNNESLQFFRLTQVQ